MGLTNGIMGACQEVIENVQCEGAKELQKRYN